MDLVGQLLAAHPLNPNKQLSQSLVLVFGRDRSGSVGLCINKPYTGINFDLVMSNVGLGGEYDALLFQGGPMSTNRVFVVHSLDWSSPSTIVLNSSIGISTDLSILAAISSYQGPEYFRACAGYHFWEDSSLESDVNSSDSKVTWSSVPADIELVFEVEPKDQWKVVLGQSVSNQVSKLF